MQLLLNHKTEQLLNIQSIEVQLVFLVFGFGPLINHLNVRLEGIS